MSLESQIRNVLKRHGFGVAATEMQLEKFNRFQLKRMLDSWNNYPACMDIYPTHLLVKRTYDE